MSPQRRLIGIAAGKRPGTWRVIYQEPDGKKHQLTFESRKLAEEWASFLPSEPTVADRLAGYLESRQLSSSLQDSSLGTIEYRLRAFFTDPMMRCRDVTQAYCAERLKSLHESHAEATVKSIRVEAEKFLQWCKLEESGGEAGPRRRDSGRPGGEA